MTPQLVTLAYIKERFDLSKYDVFGDIDFKQVIFFDGDATIDQHLNYEWATSALGHTDTGDVLIMVNGNLTVAGDIHIADYHPKLLVLGHVHCHSLISGDDTIYITGDAHIMYVFYGYYNDGSVIIEGTTYVPYVINADHHSAIKPEGAILINAYSDHNDFFVYDYTREVLKDVLDPVIFKYNDGEFDAWKFIDVVESGRAPFKAGSKPQKAIYEAELAALIEQDITTLDWHNRKCTGFPKAIAQLKQLRKLDLADNFIQEIPDEIGELVHLEELSLRSCNLQTISEKIGLCKKLRTLNLDVNKQLTWPHAIGALSALERLTMQYISTPLPDIIADLDNLEEINMDNCYTKAQPAVPFPTVLTKLKKLKRLNFRYNFVETLPDNFLQLQSLEVLNLRGCVVKSGHYPDLSQLRLLKKLELSDNFFYLKPHLFNMTSLEQLSIDRNKKQVEYFDQDTLELWEELLPSMDEEQQSSIKWVLDNKQLAADGRYYCVYAAGMTPEDLQDINNLQRLTWLDLSYNALLYLPNTFYELKNLTYIDLRHNSFPDDVKERITNTFPQANITF